MDLSSKLYLTYGGNVNHYKSVHHPLSTLSADRETTVAALKTDK